jgi:hypothetical protein
MDYFSRKSLSKYFMNTIDFSKHDIGTFIKDTWQKYAGATYAYRTIIQNYKSTYYTFVNV